MTRDEVDVSQVDMAGNTPLHLAAREGRLSTLSTLLHHGAKVHLKVKRTTGEKRRPVNDRMGMSIIKTAKWQADIILILFLE